jgi:homoserine kinase type II
VCVLGDEEEHVKLIGVYSTHKLAQEAVARLKLQPGFKDWPDGFTIDRHRLDQDSWQDGFVVAN